MSYHLRQSISSCLAKVIPVTARHSPHSQPQFQILTMEEYDMPVFEALLEQCSAQATGLQQGRRWTRVSQ